MSPLATFLAGALTGWVAAIAWSLLFRVQRMRRRVQVMDLRELRDRFSAGVQDGSLPTDDDVRLVWALLNADLREIEGASSWHLLREIGRRPDALGDDELEQFAAALRGIGRAAERDDLGPYLRRMVEAWARIATTFNLLFALSVAVRVLAAAGSPARALRVPTALRRIRDARHDLAAA